MLYACIKCAYNMFVDVFTYANLLMIQKFLLKKQIWGEAYKNIIDIVEHTANRGIEEQVLPQQFPISKSGVGLCI